MNNECITRKCAVCGEEFKPAYHMQKTCSTQCSVRYAKAWRKGFDKAKRLARLKPRTCQHCGREFQPKHGLQLACSPECRRKRDIRMTVENRRAKRGGEWKQVPIRCLHCGKEFLPHSPQVRICSDECRRQAKNKSQQRQRAKMRQTPEGRSRIREQQRMWYERRKAERVAAGLPPLPPAKPKVKDPRQAIRCAYCGKEFQPRAKDVKYCSPRCRMKTMLARKRAANVERLTLRCAVCGKEFVAQRTTKKYCSQKCASKAKREMNREWWRTYGRKRDWRAEAERKEKLRHSHGQSCGNILMGVAKSVIDEIGWEVFGPVTAN